VDVSLIVIGVIAGAYMAWNIGANDVANSMASAVGARALTMRQAKVRGFTVEFSAATVILIASMMGLPVSTTHAAVGAYLGIGLARGVAALDLAVVRRIILCWIITVPVAALTSALFYLVLSSIFLGR
jgi:PiT family inorganic phosphate transporter